jgi:hypothetical protein
MWNLFFLLLAAFSIGLVIYYALGYLLDTKGFNVKGVLVEAIITLFIGAVFSLIVALAAEYTWVMWASMAALALLRKYWMAWLYKIRG